MAVEILQSAGVELTEEGSLHEWLMMADAGSSDLRELLSQTSVLPDAIKEACSLIRNGYRNADFEHTWVDKLENALLQVAADASPQKRNERFRSILVEHELLDQSHCSQ